MAIRIRSRHGETVGQMLRRFKKLCEKEGLTKDIKRKQYFEKPSERRRRAARKTMQRVARLQQPGGNQRPSPRNSRSSRNSSRSPRSPQGPRGRS